MSKLDEWVTIHFSEDSFPGLRSGPLTQESKTYIKALMAHLIDECTIKDSNTVDGRMLRRKIRAL